MEKYTVFIASPSDVLKERDLVEEVIKEINQTHGIDVGYELELWRYEDKAFPSAQRPQDLINSIAKPYQIFIGIMWKRFGTPTANAGSGTEEEYNRAYKGWTEKAVENIMFYFCKKKFFPETPEDSHQVGKVIQFKQQLNNSSFIWDYSSTADFEKKIRKHLCLMMGQIFREKRSPLKNKTEPDEKALTIFKNVWSSMDPALQNAFTIAYNENRMKGDGGIQTRDLFAAMSTNPSPEIQAVIKHFPDGALPPAITGDTVDDPYIVEEHPWLSHCISASMERLSGTLPKGQQLTALDVFIDIAKNGTGESVAQLRKHHIDVKTIDEILKKEGLKTFQAVIH